MYFSVPKLNLLFLSATNYWQYNIDQGSRKIIKFEIRKSQFVVNICFKLQFSSNLLFSVKVTNIISIHATSIMINRHSNKCFSFILGPSNCFSSSYKIQISHSIILLSQCKQLLFCLRWHNNRQSQSKSFHKYV